MTAQESLIAYPPKLGQCRRCWFLAALVFSIAFFTRAAMAQDVKSFSLPIVVQFSNIGIAPVSLEFVSDLSRGVGVSLSYLQQTSEGEQVFLVNGLFPGLPLSDILRRLQRRADVISAAIDSTGEASDPAQIVARFSASIADPSHPVFTSALSIDVGVTLTYLFEKKPGIQAFRVNGLSQPEQLTFILQRLKKRKDVLAAEANP